ncbi:acetyl-CoA carboxylase isoform X1 [Vespula squamosa]|uniref:Acetyl-CoA carboxylase isoform X1 n=1 Tax=Vespula squamosa TaxID=30214 RepID=A0ABD2A896_VESSQ
MTEHARDDEPNLREERATPPRRIRHRWFQGILYEHEEEPPWWWWWLWWWRQWWGWWSSLLRRARNRLGRRPLHGNEKKRPEESQPRISSSSTSEDEIVHIVEPSSGDNKEDNSEMSETTPVSFVVGEPDPDAEEELEIGDSFPIDGNDGNSLQGQQFSIPPGLVERRKRLR